MGIVLTRFGNCLCRVLSWVGMTYDLKEFPHNEVEKGKLQMRQKALDGEKKQLYWGPNPATLPILKREEIDRRVANGEKLVILDGFVLNVARFMQEHPGGDKIIALELGKDITEQFKGGVYKHSNAGRNLAQTLRVGRVEGYWQ